MAHVSLGAAEGKVGPPPRNPPTLPDRFGKLLKVGELGVRIGHLVARLLEFAEKLGLCNWRRLPVAKSS